MKRYSGKHIVALLDQRVGRINAISSRQLCVGSLLHYVVERETENAVFISQVTVTDLPFVLGKEDIFFWHHVLELCFYFIPLGAQADEVFELLEFLYTVNVGVQWTKQSKKIFLFKLIASVGLYSSMPALSHVRVQQLLAVKLNGIMDERLCKIDEEALDMWLKICLADHPAVKYFKTIQFFN